MPIVYEKTQHTAAADIYSELSFCLKKNECNKVAAFLYKFWESEHPSIARLMKLINQIGWFPGYFGCPVRYDSYFQETLQYFMVTKSIKVWVYDRKRGKRHQITLSVPTTQRNKTKSMRATFANRIHQLDATIACMVILDSQKEGSLFPIYPVHEHFVSNAWNAHRIPVLYLGAFLDLLDPLFIVNRMLYENIIRYSDYPYILNRKEQPAFLSKKGQIDVHFPRKGVLKTSDNCLTREELEMVFHFNQLSPKEKA